MANFFKTSPFFMGIILLGCFTSCHNFYKSANLSPGSKSGRSIDSLKLLKRYFVLRSGSDAYYMKNIVISDDKKTLHCTLDTLSIDHKLHLVNGRHNNLQYKKSVLTDLGVLNEVHLYIPQDTAADLGHYTLALDKIEKIEVLQIDKGRTTGSYVIGAVGYTLGAFVVAVVIIAATKSSCPFVSAYSGNNFTLQGEIYGGSIYPQLARYDYLALDMAPIDNTLQLKISNELKEKQYTDIAELWVVSHDPDTKIISDQNGNLYSVSKPETPVSAWLNNSKEVTAPLSKQNDNAVLYFDDTTSPNASNEVILKFKKPSDAKNAKLILSLKNSYWLDLLYGELAKGFGRYYNHYIKSQRNKPVSELNKWIDEQQIPLSISLKTREGWKKISGITTTGPLATRDIVVPVDLTGSEGDFSEIKLSTGFMFWEIDYAGLDFTANEQYTVQKMSPVKAIDEAGRDVLNLLIKEDAKYLAQPQIGNAVTITYNIPVKEQKRTCAYILKTKGYYEHIRDFTGKPDIKFLKQFKKANAFPVYGMALYKKVNEMNNVSLAIVK